MLYVCVVITINICCSGRDGSHKVTGQSFIKWCPLKQFILHMLKKWLNQQPTLPASYVEIYSQLSLLQVGWSCGNPLLHTPERNTRQFDKSQWMEYNAHVYRKTCITIISIYTHTTFLPPSTKTIINNCQVKNVQVDAWLWWSVCVQSSLDEVG